MVKKLKSILGGGGFYAVLALCVLTAGVGGYFLLTGRDAGAGGGTASGGGGRAGAGHPRGAARCGDRGTQGTGGGARPRG